MNNNILGPGDNDFTATLKAINERRCKSCKGDGYHMRPLECNFPAPAVAMFKVICAACGGTGMKPKD